MPKYPMPVRYHRKRGGKQQPQQAQATAQPYTAQQVSDFAAHLSATATVTQRVADKYAATESDAERAQLLRTFARGLRHHQACCIALNNGDPMPDWDAVMHTEV